MGVGVRKGRAGLNELLAVSCWVGCAEADAQRAGCAVAAEICLHEAPSCSRFPSCNQVGQCTNRLLQAGSEVSK